MQRFSKLSALGAERIVAAARNAAALQEVADRVGKRVHPVILTGNVESDAAALRQAAAGGASLAFDMVGWAQDANATIAGLKSLRRGGRLVLMGSMTAVAIEAASNSSGLQSTIVKPVSKWSTEE